MSDSISKSIVELQGHLANLENQALDIKKAINALCRVAGQPAVYTDLEADSRIVSAPRRGDEYYGKPLATVVREILDERQRVGLGPATVEELYEAMKAGSYQFDASNPHNAKRGLRISLAKNTSTFHKLPNGKFGLREWYPGVKEKPKTLAQAVDELIEEDDEEAGIAGIVEAMDGNGEVEAESGVATKPR